MTWAFLWETGLGGRYPPWLHTLTRGGLVKSIRTLAGLGSSSVAYDSGCMAGLLNLDEGSVFAQDFRIVRLLGQGGMASVYEAEQISTGTVRALKVMLPELVSDARLRERFAQEARIGGRIHSDHVVQIIGAGIDPVAGLPWLAMELLVGFDLGKCLDQRRILHIDESLAIFDQLCHALAAAHAVGIVHRDLKPENVFLSTGRRAGAPLMVKVLDFGIAKIVADARTTKTAALGTPLWMAPEQSSPNQDITPATDVWALGLIAFRMLSGRHYWLSASTESVTIPMLLREILIEELVPASVRAAQLGCSGLIPPRFDSWFAACVARDATARYPDAGAAWEGLRQLLADVRPLSIVSTAMGSGAPGPFVMGSENAGMGAGPTWMTTSQGGNSTVNANPEQRPSPAKRSSAAVARWIAAGVAMGLLGLGGLCLLRARRAIVPFGSANADVPNRVSSQAESADAADWARPSLVDAGEPARVGASSDSSNAASVLAQNEMHDASPAQGPAKREPVTHKPADLNTEKPTGACALNLNSIPVANVVLDGRPLGRTPQVGVWTESGSHTVLFVGLGEDRRSVQVRCRPGETKTVAVRLASPPTEPPSLVESDD